MNSHGARPVVTMVEAYGAGAEEVGHAVAASLKVPWIGQGLTSEELEAADTRHTGHININQFFRTLGFVDMGSIELLESPMVALARQNAVVVRDLTKEGGVILGRNSTVILADNPVVLHVKLDGPVDYRVDHAAAVAGISREQAEQRLGLEDEARAEMSLELWGWDPRHTASFDLVVNTAAFGLDGAKEMILDAFARKQARLA